jgi:hypothetical protein
MIFNVASIVPYSKSAFFCKDTKLFYLLMCIEQHYIKVNIDD